MSRLKRILLVLGGAAVLAAGGAILARDRIAGWFLDRAIAEARVRAAARGVQLTGVEPGRATFTSPFSFTCEGLRGRLVVQRGVVSSGAETYAFVARDLRVRVDSVLSGRVVIVLRGSSIYKLGPDGNGSGEWLSDLDGDVVVDDVSWLHPRATAARLAEEARRLITAGEMGLPARLRGRVRFLVRRDWFEASVFSETDGRRTRIRLDRDDVRRVSAGYAQPLTETEIDLVAHFPTRAPALLQITAQAKRVAAERRRADPGFPEDAFRHVYWSYLLTRAFGAEFAEVVTDAHEIEATYEKGEANRRMDLQNNAVGRDYALNDVAEADVERRMRVDPRVVTRSR